MDKKIIPEFNFWLKIRNRREILAPEAAENHKTTERLAEKNLYRP